MIDYDVEYDNELECYCLYILGEMVFLEAQNYSDAAEEAAKIVESWEI